MVQCAHISRFLLLMILQEWGGVTTGLRAFAANAEIC